MVGNMEGPWSRTMVNGDVSSHSSKPTKAIAQGKRCAQARYSSRRQGLRATVPGIPPSTGMKRTGDKYRSQIVSSL
eukprot:scaffold4600_cov169-Amphora_coffeaeformis.AAC.12